MGLGGRTAGNDQSGKKGVSDSGSGGPQSPRCSTCLGECHWVEGAWVCWECGDEWYPDHGPEFAAPPEEKRPLITGDRPLSPRGRTVDPFEEGG